MANGIRYCDDSEPGITRRKIRDKWAYFDNDGARIADRDEIDRLNAIGLPPAYRDAWFSADPTGHIQAIGWDEKGRKQYRYHLDFRAAQESAKYELCGPFGQALPKLRAKVEADLETRSLAKDSAVSAIVRLLDIGHIRVGNEAYAAANESFGATTLRKRHAKIGGKSVKLQFKAKSGKMRVMTITDRSLARFVKRCQDLPGQHLFHWLDGDGVSHPVTSSDVNDYIHDAMGAEFSAKHFRTWGASVIAFETLATAPADITLKQLLEPVTEALGNTPSIARKSYVHPLLIDLVKDGQSAFREAVQLPRSTQYLSRAERGLIAFLEAGVVSESEAA